MALSSFAQSHTVAPITERGYGMVKTNILVQYDHNWGDVSDGFSAKVSYQILRNKKFSLSANFRHSSVTAHFESDDFSDIKSYSPTEINMNGTHTLEQLGATVSYYSTLFGKPLVGMGIMTSEWGVGGFNRLSGIVMALSMLKVSRDTQFGIGPLLLINTASKIPAFPVFIYKHRFDSHWAINLYGSMFGVDYTPSKNDLLAVGADFDVKSYYFKPHNTELPKTCRYTQSSFRPMIKYRHRFLTYLYLDIQTGLSINMKSRVTGENGSTEHIVLKKTNSPFVMVSISYSL